MENFKFTVFSIVVLLILVFIGYWGFSTIQSGSSSVDSQKLVELMKQNKDLMEKSGTLSNQIAELQGEVDKLTKENQEAVAKATTKITTPSTYKYQDLINSLQKLVAGNITMKNGSRGTRVGIIQKFLNVYNNTSNKIDNDFGSGTETIIKKFQKDTGLRSDGEVGPGTLKKMISWLKSKD